MASAKRINIVSVKLVKESSMLYKQRRVRSPQDSYELFRDYLGEVGKFLTTLLIRGNWFIERNMEE
ncbi:hypothetical protein [Lysinibacillus capsici]|uniref:hypothetical protein n=1 Tax=Lysinibacillus capsici TaxID=2115968 RepID=UPI003081FA36|nr:hypothetical protein ICJ70_00480 [Lysinibacillus capsici]